MRRIKEKNIELLNLGGGGGGGGNKSWWWIKILGWLNDNKINKKLLKQKLFFKVKNMSAFASNEFLQDKFRVGR